MPEGQVDPRGPLIDRSTLARRFLLRPQGLRASSSLHTALTNEDEAAGRGCTGRWQSPAQWGHTAGQRHRERESIGRAQGEGLINGSRFGPNTQLGDLTKCFVSSPPLFFLARHSVWSQKWNEVGEVVGLKVGGVVLELSDYHFSKKRWEDVEDEFVFLYDRKLNYLSFLAMLIFCSLI